MAVPSTRCRTPGFVKKQRIYDSAQDHRHQQNVKIFTERLLGPSKPLIQAQSLKSLDSHKLRTRRPISRESVHAITPSSSFLAIPRDLSAFRLQTYSIPYAETMSSARNGVDDDSVIMRNIERAKALTPEAIARSRQEKQIQDAMRLKIARETSIQIKIERKSLFLEAFKDKTRRFQIRMMGDKLNAAARGWTKVLLYLQITKTMVTKTVNVKRHRYRVKKMLGLWVRVVQIVRKLLGRLWICRRRKAMKVLGKFKVYIRKWKRRRRRGFAEKLAGYLTGILVSEQFREGIERWSGKCWKVYNFLWSLVLRRDAQVELMVLQWERYEAESLSDLRKRAGRRPTIAQRNAMTEVPRYLKTMHCLRYYRTLQFRFLKHLKEYWSPHLGEIPVMKPHFSVLLEYDDVLILHKGALKIRHMWDESMYHPERKA